MTVIGANCVVDLYHKDQVTDWDQVKAAGIVAIIHKATEALTFTDDKYKARKAIAKKHGLLWGSYHYSSGDDPIQQAGHYLSFARPEADEVVCLDCEPTTQPKHGPHLPNMTFDQLLAYVTHIRDRLGRLPMIYGGSSLLSPLLAGRPASIVNDCPLWFAEYPKSTATKPQVPLPHGWPDWTLWQYAADGNGPLPHTVPGIGACDRDTFNGTVDQLRARWPFGTLPA